MLCLDQESGIKLTGVSAQDAIDMQAMLDAARGAFDANQQIKNMLTLAHSTNSGKVFLVEEGWHQLEKLYGVQWKHITIRCTYGSFHCYAQVTEAMDRPVAVTHRITSITCRGGRVEVRIA